jgi:Protein of unknown function (DUF2752)
VSSAATLLRLRAPQGQLPLGAIFGGIAIVATVAVGVLHLDRLGFPVCLFKAGTGLPCPACGSTRALGRLFALDISGAFAMNPLATVGAFAVVPWAIADLVLLTRGRALDVTVAPSAGLWLRIAAVVAVTANWVWLVASGR